jgi:2Fe-2S ferredoxin
MSAAVQSGVPGILAECGGFLSCATCHVYVDDAWMERVNATRDPDVEMEDEMLDGAMAERLKGSRLSCQIPVVAELDGLVVRVAPEQA